MKMLSPMMTLTAIIVVSIVGVIGVSQSPESQGPGILLSTGAIITVLLGFLKSDYDKAQLSKKVDENTQVTVEARKSAETAEKKVDDLNLDRKVSNLRRDLLLEQIKDLAVKVEQQTNGDLSKRFEELRGYLEKKIDDKASVIIESVKKTSDSHG